MTNLIDTTDTTPTNIQTSSNKHIRSAYSPQQKHQLHFTGPGRTKQSFRDECDINTIMARYQATGELPNINQVAPEYLDATGFDYQEHQNFIAGANSMFHALPSGIRARFGNSPAEFLDFCSHEKNRPELTEMGLLRPIAEPLIPTPTLTPSTAPTASKEAAPQTTS